jgi:hypothetical protein
MNLNSGSVSRKRRVTREQRRPLELLAISPRGVNEELLVLGPHGFRRRMLADLSAPSLPPDERDGPGQMLHASPPSRGQNRLRTITASACRTRTVVLPPCSGHMRMGSSRQSNQNSRDAVRLLITFCIGRPEGFPFIATEWTHTA